MRFAMLVLLLGGVATASPGTPVLLVQDLECPACKAKLKPGAQFCTNCGQKIATRECPDCKAALKPDAKFCTNCGKKFDEPEKKGPVGREPDPDKVKETKGDALEKFGVTAEQINQAIDRGAAFLAGHYRGVKELRSDEDYLAAYALIHTKVFHSDVKLKAKILALLKSAGWLKSGRLVYIAGLRALALEATHDPEMQSLAGECAQYLIEAQGPRGTWSYQEKVELEAPARAKPAEESAFVVAGGQPLDEAPAGIELTFKGLAKSKPSDGDNSCTQFALLGLHAASKCGFKVPEKVWRTCLDQMLERAGDGWAYHDKGKPYGSMTCAGICSVALCRYYLGEKEYLQDAALKAGLEWLGKNFKAGENPDSGKWPLYYLYSVERVGVFAGTETIGEHRWYPLGAKHLVGMQQKDGSWSSNDEYPVVGTSLALLFLTRATAPVKKEIKRGGKGWLETHALNEFQNFMFILDASGSMRDDMDGREKFEVAKEVVEAIIKKMPEGTHVGLRVYGHRYTALDERADTDSELVVPVGPLKADAFLARLRALKCKGKTPITYSLNETAKDLSGLAADIELATILLTDGEESTRGANPVEAASKLAASRQGMKVHVVGFDIGDDDVKEKLQKVAQAGGGKYFHALKAADLMSALAYATVGQTDYTLLDKDGRESFKGKLGDRHELPEGKYTLSVAVESVKAEQTVWINTEATTHVTVNMARFLKK